MSKQDSELKKTLPVAGLAASLVFCYVFSPGCESNNRNARQWPAAPTIISQSELARSGFATPSETQAQYSLENGKDCPTPLTGFERESGWRAINPAMETRIVNGLTVGAEDYVLKVGPAWGGKKEKYAGELLLKSPIPEVYSQVAFDARAKEDGLKLAIGLLYEQASVDPYAPPEAGRFVVYESTPVPVPVNWKRSIRFNLRQLDTWRLQGEDIYSRNLPNLPVSGIQLIIYGDNVHNSVVVDHIAFQ